MLDRPDVLNSMLPGLGRDWTEILGGSQAVIFYWVVVYAMEWEVVAAHWARDDHALLQPATPCWNTPAMFCNALMKAKTAKKELELCVDCDHANHSSICSADSQVTLDRMLCTCVNAPCVCRLGVTGSTGVIQTTLMSSGGKALAAEAAAET